MAPPVHNPVASAAWSEVAHALTRQTTHPTVIQPEVKVMAKLKALEDLAPDTPAMRWLISTTSLLVDLFKLSMASMLSVFVPQLCPASTNQYISGRDPGTIAGDFVGPAVAHFQTRSDGCTNNPVDHDCTFEENFICLSTFNKFVLAWNFLCLFFLLFHYVIVWKRENFMIQHLKETLLHGRLHLKSDLPHYPTLQIRLHRYNRVVFNTSFAVIILQVVNVIASGYLCMELYLNGYKTYTTYCTNLLLISIVLYSCISAAYVGLKHELAYSCIGCQTSTNTTSCIGSHCVVSRDTCVTALT
jgi:hypothetical protein